MARYLKSYAALTTIGSGDRTYGSVRKVVPDGPEAQALVRGELYRHFRYPKVSGNNICVPCCFHRQGERFTRTLSVNLVSHQDNKNRDIAVGQYHCWSCGAKGGWNQLAEHEGLAKLDEVDNFQVTGKAVVEKAQYTVPAGLRDLNNFTWTKKGITITNATLEAVDAKHIRHRFRTDSGFVRRKMLWLPAHEHGEVVGHVLADIRGDGPVPYLNSPGAWVLEHFLGYDEAVELSRKWEDRGYRRFCCVVEGPRDWLVMYQNNIPAVACLGSNSWSRAKANALAMGFDMVFAVGDGDLAGRKLNKAVIADLADALPVRRIKLPDEEDPASLDHAGYKSLHSILKKHAAVRN